MYKTVYSTHIIGGSHVVLWMGFFLMVHCFFFYFIDQYVNNFSYFKKQTDPSQFNYECSFSLIRHSYLFVVAVFFLPENNRLKVFKKAISAPGFCLMSKCCPSQHFHVGFWWAVTWALLGQHKWVPCGADGQMYMPMYVIPYGHMMGPLWL